MNDYQQGWVRFYRKSINSTVWTNPTVWMVWSWCLLKASHKDCKFPFNGQDMELKAGSFITGQSKATKELPISAQMWRTAMTYLKSTSRVTIKTTNKFSVITIVKWGDYQHRNQDEKPKSTSKPTNEQQTTNKPLTTYKNVNNVNNKDFSFEKSLPKIMKKYNENDHSDSDIPSVSFETGENINPPAKKEGKNKIALRLQNYFISECEKNTGTKPIKDGKGYFVLVDALNYLSEDQLKLKVHDWFGSGVPIEQMVSLPRCFSHNAINTFKVANGIK